MEGDALGQGEHEGDGVIRHFAGAVVRGVADWNARCAPKRQIHVVEAHRGLHDDAAALQSLQVLGGWRHADDGVAATPLLVRHVVKAAAELRLEAFAQGIPLHGVVASKGAGPQHPKGHRISRKTWRHRN